MRCVTRVNCLVLIKMTIMENSNYIRGWLHWYILFDKDAWEGVHSFVMYYYAVLLFIIRLGQFICGEKHCKKAEGLRSWEVNFAYLEHEKKKNALVKISK